MATIGRIIASVVVALALASCADNRQVVPLQYVDLSPDHGCYLSGPTYLLVADPSFGVGAKMSPTDGSTYPIYWPKGYVGHRVGADVEVSDEHGQVVAVTGRTYMIRSPSNDQAKLIGTQQCMGEMAVPT